MVTPQRNNATLELRKLSDDLEHERFSSTEIALEDFDDDCEAPTRVDNEVDLDVIARRPIPLTIKVLGAVTALIAAATPLVQLLLEYLKRK